VRNCRKGLRTGIRIAVQTIDKQQETLVSTVRRFSVAPMMDGID
jgi:hypothetical protein